MSWYAILGLEEGAADAISEASEQDGDPESDGADQQEGEGEVTEEATTTEGVDEASSGDKSCIQCAFETGVEGGGECVIRPPLAFSADKHITLSTFFMRSYWRL